MKKQVAREIAEKLIELEKVKDWSLKELIEEIMRNTERIDGGERFVINGHTFLVFESEDEAERYALALLSDELQENPENFDIEWLAGYIELSDYDLRTIAKDLTEIEMEGKDEKIFLEEAGLLSEYEELEEKLLEIQDKMKEAKSLKEIDELKIERDDVMEKQDDLVYKAQEKVREDIYDKYYDKLQNNPIDLLVYDLGLYDINMFFKEFSYAINVEKAAKDALKTDGWEHFVAIYDDKSYVLDDGYIFCQVD